MNILKTILLEQRAFDYQKVITDAIKNRRKISFYYNGPLRPKKFAVKPGRRILVDPTTLGLTKKGNLAFKGYVKPPSVTKTGFEKHGWRTFLLNRIHRLELTDDTFDKEPPGYVANNNDESFSKIYIQTDFNKKPRINKYDQPVYPKLGRRPIDKTKTPDIEPVKTTYEPELTPIVPKEKPTIEPTDEPEVGTEIKPDIPQQDIGIEDMKKQLYSNKKRDWINKQKEIGGNIKPGQGTRQKFKKEIETELPQPKVKEKPPVNPEGDDNENKNLQEQINKIKSLMFKIKVL